MVRPLCSFQCARNKKLAKGKKQARKKKIKNAKRGKSVRVTRGSQPSLLTRGNARASSRVAVACGMQSKDGDDTLKGLPTWLGDLWGLASPQPPAPLSRASSMSRTSSKPTLPVFFDRDGRVGPTKLWLKETHAVAGLTLDKDAKEKQKQEAELARAAQVALEIAQVRCLVRGTCFRFINIPRLRCLLTSRFTFSLPTGRFSRASK